MLAIALTACGVQPRTSNAKSADMPALQDPKLAMPENEGSFAGFFELSGFRWSIREAKPRARYHPHSDWHLGAALPIRGVLAKESLATTEALAWPDDPDSILMVQIRGNAAGDWTARCVMADGSVDETFAPHRIGWDSESESGLIPLDEIFGRRGQRRDPATACSILVRLDSSQGGATAQLSLRVLGGLPAPEPTERKDHGWNVGGIFREEVWKNEGFRGLNLQISGTSTIAIQSKLRHGKSTGDGQGLRSLAEGVQVEARVIAGEVASSWRPLPLQLRWSAGSTLRVEYRLAPGAGTRVCEPVIRIPIPGTKIVIPLRVQSRQFSGMVTWESIVSEETPRGSEAAPRKSSKKEVQRGDDVLGIPAETNPFACQGWVP
jgi:hypothetical protein